MKVGCWRPGAVRSKKVGGRAIQERRICAAHCYGLDCRLRGAFWGKVCPAVGSQGAGVGLSSPRLLVVRRLRALLLEAWWRREKSRRTQRRGHSYFAAFRRKCEEAPTMVGKVPG